MSHLKKSIAIIAALAGSGFTTPMSSAQDVINIANTKGAQESNYFASQPQTRSGGFVKPYAKVEGWEIVRVTKRNKFDHCAAWKITGSETGLRLAITANKSSFGFSGYGSAAMGNAAPLSVWFNDNEDSAESLGSRLVNDHSGFPWMMISESNDEPGLFDDAIPNSNKVSFAYPVDGKNHVESFSLKGTKRVVARLIACRDGR